MLAYKRMNIVISKLDLVNKNVSGTYQLNHHITRNTGKMADHVFFTELIFLVKDTLDVQYPLNMTIALRGVFEFEPKEAEADIIEFLKKDAVHILYPYLRSTVTNLTTAAMLPPLFIPFVDAYHLFKEDQAN
ncbi:protein-export chaperone SecB [Paracholeplasma manati]|uniref:Protein-export chaperone SecB n=1 Tax=Paracholeplasma manati TaxID=591373 RepID=A0ABT2Y828_9MOLU|nr:protein-export chaperone SecB [Paracholeplasma manati]MCV2232637.1 protein-export chaperone SecB [Paracholeplasma manati]MDG0889498.1 protein-export chaperone SecB [Paracholeplasma manati]